MQYLLVVDALNFCFWPAEDLEYEQLATGVKVAPRTCRCNAHFSLQIQLGARPQADMRMQAAAMNDPDSLTATRLQQYTGKDVQKLFNCQQAVPLLEERARLLREVCILAFSLGPSQSSCLG